MYEHIYVPVDNSDYSNRAIQAALTLGRSYDSQLTGCHVYAARMHDYRFKQMEFTLPEEYLEENELERQRKIHDSLITMGLELISDCYLNDMEKLCTAQGLPFAKKMMDGKHATEIVNDISDSDYDLVVLGALGIGRTKDSQIGSVCERVTRYADRDVWVVKHVPEKGEAERDAILVGIDGSPESFGALMTGIDLAERFGKQLELVSVYDPYLHYAVFKGIVEVLTERAAKIFRFEEQNQLHEEVIDTGLAEIYQSHLNVAEAMAAERGVEVTKTLLDGKAFQKMLDHVRKTNPWLVIVGRTGVHSEEGAEGLGSNTENLLRLCPCDLLITTHTVLPDLDLKAEESIHWTEEAEERMTRVPDMVKGIARTAILRIAVEKGHSVVTTDLVTEAMDRFMPKSAAERTEKLAEALAFEKARQGRVSICRQCGLAARESSPVKCTVCGAVDFEVVTQEVLEQIAESEGGIEEEVTYDGRKLRWTKESRKALRAIGDSYQRRRAKARIEKSARGKKISTITVEFAQRFIEEETGVLYKAAEEQPERAVQAEVEEAAAVEVEEDPDLKLIARDDKNHPLLSRYAWAPEAVERILRVPAGFMRDKTQGRVEEIAAARHAAEIDLRLVEEGIQIGIDLMQEMISQSASVEEAAAQAAVQAKADLANGKSSYGNGSAAKADEGQKSAGKCPFSSLMDAKPEAGADPAKLGMTLNEVGVMAELEKRRRELGDEPN